MKDEPSKEESEALKMLRRLEREWAQIHARYQRELKRKMKKEKERATRLAKGR